jgi:hypothetical protein
MLGYIDTDLYAKIKPDPRWKELRSKHGIEDFEPGSVQFNYTLPSGAHPPIRD